MWPNGLASTIAGCCGGGPLPTTRLLVRSYGRGRIQTVHAIALTKAPRKKAANLCGAARCAGEAGSMRSQVTLRFFTPPLLGTAPPLARAARRARVSPAALRSRASKTLGCGCSSSPVVFPASVTTTE